LFACTDAKQRQRALQVISDMHNRLQREAPHRAMLSPSYHTLNETFAQRDTVDELLGLAERRGWSGLTDSDHVQASWRLEQFREVALAHPGLLAGPITALVEHDREHGTELVATLRAFFDAVGDIRVASEQLGVHVNTVRHRIRRAQQLAGLDLGDADERLLAELQVRLLT
jgi:sugar diacid utilization regulator